MSSRRQRAYLGVIKAGRRLLVNSPANKWRITSNVKSRIFRMAYPDAEERIEYLGAKLAVPTKDTSLVPALVGGYYEKLELEIFRAVAAKSRTIVDVGGNIGLYAIVGALAQGTEGKVYSFEPVAENLSYLHKNLALNKLDDGRVSVVEAALGDKSGELTIYLSEGNVGTHSASKETAQAASTTLQGDGASEVVMQLTLDSYVRKNNLKQVDILKVDVEGFDGQVLRGAQKLLAQQRPTLFVEYIPWLLKNCGFSAEEYIKLLTPHYEYCFAIDELGDRVRPLDVEALQRMKTKGINLIFVHNPAHIQILQNWNRPAAGTR